jgi:hypothetical protein
MPTYRNETNESNVILAFFAIAKPIHLRSQCLSQNRTTEVAFRRIKITKIGLIAEFGVQPG